ncbi:MAG: iron ABC transporter permease [Clostridia bacterium]
MANRPRRLLVGALGLLVALMAVNLCAGVSSVSPAQMLSALTAGDVKDKAYRIFLYVRLPRALAAVMAGAALAASGHLLQSVLRNPLASPSIIGVNAGAGLFALVVMAFFPALVGLVPVAAFLGACVAAFAVYFLATLTGASKTTLVLSGVAVSSLLGAVMDAIVTLVPDAAVSRSAFSIGGFAGVSLQSLAFSAPFLLVGTLIAALFRRELSILALGDEVAQGLGVRVTCYRTVFLLAAAMLAGCAVSFAGLIGFVGLITPHAARMLLKEDERLRLPIAMTLGADLCLGCDFAARTLFAPYEMPVGVLLAFLGAPFFIFLLYRQKRSNRHDAA